MYLLVFCISSQDQVLNVPALIFQWSNTSSNYILLCRNSTTRAHSKPRMLMAHQSHTCRHSRTLLRSACLEWRKSSLLSECKQRSADKTASKVLYRHTKLAMSVQISQISLNIPQPASRQLVSLWDIFSFLLAKML